MFVLKKESEYYWPVSFQIPTDGGIQKKFDIECCFRRLKQSRLAEVIKTIKEQTITDLEFSKEIVVGWRGVKDAQNENEDLPFTEFNLQTLIEIPGVAGAITTAFIESITGTKIKN